MLTHQVPPDFSQFLNHSKTEQPNPRSIEGKVETGHRVMRVAGEYRPEFNKVLHAKIALAILHKLSVNCYQAREISRKLLREEG